MADDQTDMVPENHAATDARTPPEHRDEDARSDLEQAVGARADAVERGEGGPEPESMTGSGEYSGVGGDAGVVRNQDLTQQ